jgi:hypothetical protein
MAGTYLMGRADERAGRPFSLANPAHAADQAAGTGSNSIVPDRYVYYPGTEVLAEKEVPSGSPRPVPASCSSSATAKS